MWIDNKHYTEPELAAYVKELENKITELEDKHWEECIQIAHYDDELSKAKKLFLNNKTPFEDYVETILHAVTSMGVAFGLKSDFYKGYCAAIEHIQDFIKENNND